MCKSIELDSSEVVGSLNPNEIRWFYQSRAKDENSFLPFCGRDSLLIELKYRLEGCIPFGHEFPGFDDALKACQSSTVSVLNGYYEIDIAESVIKAIYWKEAKKIVRGTWFFDKFNILVVEKLCRAIEIEHLNRFAGCPIPEPLTAMDDIFRKPALHTSSIGKQRVEWRSAVDITLHETEQGILQKLLRRVSRKPKVRRIRRGYGETASFADGPLPVNRLVFIVHGIGQKKFVDHLKNCNSMRTIAEKLLDTRFQSQDDRPMFLPVEWRTSLALDGETIDSITAPNLRLLRASLNATFMDLMYYCSPKFRLEITHGFVNVTNALYGRFLAYNLDFTDIGEISIVAHSLGSVIAFDVITNYSPLSQYENFVTDRLQRVVDSPLVSEESKQRLKKLREARLASAADMDLALKLESGIDKLKFEVQNLFCLGSPLAVFLALRGQTGAKLLPQQPSVYNLFNINDPVAYRLEPLIHPLYSKITPVRIQPSNEIQIPYSKMPLELYEPTDQAVLSTIDRLPYRIDYATKENRLRISAYFNASTAHLEYWDSEDFVLFILTRLCRPPMSK